MSSKQTRPKVQLTRVSEMAPEKYKASIDGKEIGELILQHGTFTTNYGNSTVLVRYPTTRSQFHDDSRHEYLVLACNALIDEHLIRNIPKAKAKDSPYEIITPPPDQTT